MTKTYDESPEPFDRSLADRLASRYLLVTVIIFAIVGIPSYFFLASQLENQFVDNYSEFALSTAELVFSAHLDDVEGGAFTRPLEGEELASFLNEVQREVDGAGLIGINVWRPDGMLLYSMSGHGVGGMREISGGFAHALDSGAFVKITEWAPDREGITGASPTSDALEIYLPLRRPDGSLANVFELYYSVEPLNEGLAAMRTKLGISLLIIFLAVAAVGQLGARLLVRRNQQLATMAEQLAQLAETDAITGVANHRHFVRQLSRELKAAGRYHRRLSLIMADLDFFKSVNDAYGHQTGDLVLREAATVMAASVRSTDLVARYGGEEFAVILPETSEQDALNTAERLRKQISGIQLPVGEKSITLTASFGVAEFPSAATTLAELVAAADSALYHAKRSGRNRVCAFSQLPGGAPSRAEISDLCERLERAGAFTVQALAAAVVGRVDRHHAHQDPIAIARLAGRVLRLPPRDREALVLAASVYDVGKMAVPGEILTKPGTLTPEEIEAIRQHSESSEQILATIGDLERILKVVRHHHEHFNGSGYPDGLKGTDIPYLARVLLVIDAYTAMTAERPYRKAMTPAEAVVELRRHAGTQFDPEVVEKLAAVLRDPAKAREAAA